MTDTVEAIVAEMRDAAGDYEQWGRETMEAFADRLQSAHDAEARDARRYRWLREHAQIIEWCDAGMTGTVVWETEAETIEDDDPTLDAAIDRAMEGEDG